jgi:hypothetical protein
LGLLGYILQLSAGRLKTPWYMPVLATLGVILVVSSLRQRRAVWRVLALVAVCLLAGAEWLFVLAGRQEPYNGPVAVGKPIPAFTTFRNDGRPFTQDSLTGDQKNVLVFFRGRW